MSDTRKIIRNAFIIPCDGNELGGIGTVTIRNDRITSVSYGQSRGDMPAPDVEVVDGTGKVLLPGFVDLHVHGESMLLDLLTAGEPQSRWPRLGEYARAEKFWYQMAGLDDWRKLYTTVCYQALRSGVTFLGEFGVPGGDQACVAALEAFSRTELPGMLTLHNADQLERVDQWAGRSLRFSIALPPAEELTTYNLQASLRLSRDSGYPVMVHLSDGGKDGDIVQRNFNKGIISLLDEFGMLDTGCMLVHYQPDHPKDLQKLSGRSAIPIISPGGAGRRGTPIPDHAVFGEGSIERALCTDWGAFSHWAMMRSLAERHVQRYNERAPVMQYLRDLTVNPARAMGMSAEMGSVVLGKKAHVQMVRCRDLYLQGGLEQMSPAEVAQALVLRASSSDVSDVMVNGEFSIREGTVLTYSEEDIVRDIAALLNAPRQKQDPVPVRSGYGGDSALVQEERHVQSDEGFRIIRRSEEELPKATILPLDPERDAKDDKPGPVRKVFGDDDV